MSEYTYYENLRDAPRISKSVFVKYEFRDPLGKTVGTGIATTKDMSITGMKFLCAVSIVKKDYVVKLSIQLDRQTQIGIVGVVTWVETPKPKQYLVGIRFHSISEVSKAKLLKFLHSSVPAT
jgi:c-di-GMP-binding flagellar brake protein YcgR